MLLEEVGLELLLEEKATIRNRISKAMKDLKIWFYRKIDEVANFRKEVIRRFNESIKNIFKDRNMKLTKDVKHDGKIILKKGSDFRAFKNGSEVYIDELKMDTDIVIRDSKKGIDYVINNDEGKALYIKDSVISGIKETAAMGAVILAIAASAKVALIRQDKQFEEDRFNQAKSNFEYNERRTRKVYDVELDQDEGNNDLVVAFA